jgi:hypothetical protein
VSKKAIKQVPLKVIAMVAAGVSYGRTLLNFHLSLESNKTANVQPHESTGYGAI